MTFMDPKEARDRRLAQLLEALQNGNVRTAAQLEPDDVDLLREHLGPQEFDALLARLDPEPEQ